MKKEQIEQLLNYKIKFTPTLLGYFTDKAHDWKHFAYSCNLNNKILTTYRMGLGHSRLPKKHYYNSKDVTHLKRIGIGDKEGDGTPTTVEGFKVIAVHPTIVDVLYSLQSDASLAADSHEDFCYLLGISTDSRKGLEDYLACQESGKQYRELMSIFTIEERNQIEDFLQNY